MKFNEALKITIRGYRLWWDANPRIILAPIFCATAEGLAPFVGIYLSARIINELAGARDAGTLAKLVVATLVSAAVLSLVIAGLRSFKNCQDFHLWYTRMRFAADKLQTMDFEKMDSPKTWEMLNDIEGHEEYAGWGLNRMVAVLEPATKAVMTMIGAASLTFSLFTKNVPAASSYAILNHPLFLLFIIIMLLAITLIAPAFANKASAFWTRYFDTQMIGDRLRYYYGSAISDRWRALDARIYRQDRIADVALSQESIFSPGSQIAKWAKGPMGGYHALSGAASQIFTGAAYLLVCLKALGGAFGIGSVTQYVASITALSAGLSELVKNAGDLRNNAPFVKKIFDFLDLPNEMEQGSLTVEKQPGQKYEIEFRNVSFQYPGQEAYALRNISLTFAIGERLAVVGMNGSGKTTFIKLLCRLYDPVEGEILLNGTNIRKYDYQEYMSLFSVVFQDFQLLSAPVGQNIAAHISYDENRAAECLNSAGFGERLAALPKGLQTILYKIFDEQGVDVSGGEAQKIALARALYKNAPFIVLDEPTAALDPVAEFEVYNRMNEIVADKTAVFISHRLSSCRFCQNIAVFHEGEIVQRGSHDSLAADEAGKYFELWNAQAQYYVDAQAGG
jgi:ATP-binding cassette subfamily B protein